MALDSDPRARIKSLVRKYPLLAAILQWVFDPAFTPKYLISEWVKQQPGYVLNFGSGSRFLGERVVNLDIEDSAYVHVVNKSEEIPFKDNSFDAVLLEYVLEHVEDYLGLLKDVVRVLKPGGSLLVTVPFRQNYHACPQDYWRFTHEGLEALFSKLEIQNPQIDVYGGPVSAWIDGTKEFLATIFSFGSPLLYAILSQLFIVPFIPLRYLDVFFRKLPVAKYTAFSLKAVAQKAGHLELNSPDQPLEVKIQESLIVPEGYQCQRRNQSFWIAKV